LFGVNVHVTPVTDEQLKVRGSANPFRGVTVIVADPECPAMTATVVGLEARVKGMATETTAGAAEVEDPLVVLPLKVDVTLFVPTGRVVGVNAAVPPERVACPRGVEEPLL
jgi:hypothetical protein